MQNSYFNKFADAECTIIHTSVGITVPRFTLSLQPCHVRCQVDYLGLVVLAVLQIRKIPHRAHALLQEAGVNLVEILNEEGYLESKRRLTGNADAASVKRRASNFGRCGFCTMTGPLEVHDGS